MDILTFCLIVALFAACCAAGFALFARSAVRVDGKPFDKPVRVSVIVPARNEETNLPHLLSSLKEQTFRPCEIIVVDDQSSDRTAEVARSFGATVVANGELPEGWTGKTWAVWNGYRRASGDVLAFIDADVRLAPKALESLIRERDARGGAISVIPYHAAERFYETLAFLPNLLGIFAFTSPFERSKRKKGLYGACILVDRAGYETVRGHDSVKSLMLDDISLGRELSEAGVKVTNFVGADLVRFRMYPYGLRSELEGFGKGAVLSTATLSPLTVALIVPWLLGLIAVQFATPVLAFAAPALAVPFAIGYALYTLQFISLMRYVGRFGWIVPLFHGLSTAFFLVVLGYSVYQTQVRGTVIWKGREIRVRK